LYSLELIHALSHQEWQEPWCILLRIVNKLGYGLWTLIAVILPLAPAAPVPLREPTTSMVPW
jgi:hypothetical protein